MNTDVERAEGGDLMKFCGAGQEEKREKLQDP